MAQPLRMHQIRRILELSQQGYPIRETARLTGMSRNTARDYLRRAQSSGMDAASLLQLDDQALTALFYVDALEKKTPGRTSDARYSAFEVYLEKCSSELGKRGVTRQLLWEEYRHATPDGYGYTQFCEYLKRYLLRDQAVMQFTHRPAEQLQVDFAGDKLGYIDKSTGEWISCPVLVCVLPYSHYVYAEALQSEKQDAFIGGLVRALEYIGGVPLSIKCDNMRTAVVRANRYEPDFTEAMEFLGAHYQTTILAARVRKPRDYVNIFIM